MTANPPIKVSAAGARNNFAEILGRVHFGRETFLIEKQGKPFAVVMGIDEYRSLLASVAEDPGMPADPPGPFLQERDVEIPENGSRGEGLTTR